MTTYIIIAVLLFALELGYFWVADRFNIIDKPNERSSHSTIVLRGGGVIFLLAMWVWSAFYGFQYPWFLAAVTLIAGVSFVDDIRSLPDSVRLVAQFGAMGMMFWELWSMGTLESLNGWWLAAIVIAALIVCVGASNIINFMDGINGITAGYALAVLLPLALVNLGVGHTYSTDSMDCSCMFAGFVEESFLWGALISVLVFAFFNFRHKGKAKCFAGDVGSIGIAFIMLFGIGRLIMVTGDVTWLVMLIVYGADGCLTICHRIMLHENLGEAHRKHAYQLMANELKMSHPLVSSIYMVLQLAISLGFIYLCPDTSLAHWIYLIGSFVVLAVVYILFKKKYYHLHEEYLRRVKHQA